MMNVGRIILASGSPRRKALLESIGLKFEVYRPDADESVRDGETPSELCRRLARLKAEAGMRVFSANDVIIAADTIVVIDGEILGKPVDRKDAGRMLRLLSGREHEVITGIAVSYGGELSVNDEHTLVRFRRLTDEEISEYLSTGEGDDKAGAYAVQGKGALMIESITGDYFNVVGLPLCRLGLMLKSTGIRI